MILAQLFHFLIPRFPLHESRDGGVRPAPAFAQQGFDPIEKLLGSPRRAHQRTELEDLWQRRRHDRQTRSEVFAQLQGVGRQGKLVDHERQDGDIEGLAVRGEGLVTASSQKVDIGELAQRRRNRLNLSDQQERPLRSGSSQVANDLEIHPIGDQSKEADHGPLQRRAIRRRRNRIGRQAVLKWATSTPCVTRKVFGL